MKLTLFSIILILSVGCIKEETVNVTKKRVGDGGTVSASTPAKWSESQFNPSLNVTYSSDFDGDFAGGDYDGNGYNPIEQMMKKWNEAHGTYSFFKLPADAVANKSLGSIEDFRDSELGIYKSTSWYNNVSSSALAVTQYFGYRRSGTKGTYVEIIHADIVVNYRDFSFSTDSSSTLDYDFYSVIIHELGHFLGLFHQNDFSVPSVMQPYLSVFDSNRSLETYDSSQITSKYDGSSLTAQNLSSVKTASGTQREDNEEDLVRGIIELRSNGNCMHFENGIHVGTHYKD